MELPSLFGVLLALGLCVGVVGGEQQQQQQTTGDGGGSGYFSPRGSLLGGSDEGGSGSLSSSWSERSAYGSGFTCLTIPQNFSLCRTIGYSTMMVPNLLGHDSLSEADYHVSTICLNYQDNILSTSYHL